MSHVHNSIETLNIFSQSLKTLSKELSSSVERVQSTIIKIEEEIRTADIRLRNHVRQSEENVRKAQASYHSCMQSRKNRGCYQEEKELREAVQQQRGAKERYQRFKQQCRQLEQAIGVWKRNCSQHELLGNDKQIQLKISDKKKTLENYLRFIRPV